MRKIITWEGEEKVPGIIIEKGALTWGDDPIPVCWNFQYDIENLLGNATDLRREDDGSITAEITFDEENEKQRQAKEVLEHGDVTTTVYVTNLAEADRRTTGPKRSVTAGRIRTVNLVMADSVDWD